MSVDPLGSSLVGWCVGICRLPSTTACNHCKFVNNCNFSRIMSSFIQELFAIKIFEPAMNFTAKPVSEDS